MAKKTSTFDHKILVRYMLVDVGTVKHTDAREIGAEWKCLQAIRELEIDKFLEKQGWSEVKISTALAHLITRTVYSPVRAEVDAHHGRELRSLRACQRQAGMASQ